MASLAWLGKQLGPHALCKKGVHTQYCHGQPCHTTLVSRATFSQTILQHTNIVTRNFVTRYLAMHTALSHTTDVNHTYAQTNTYKHTNIHTYIHTHIHTYIHTHIHTYIHTHIHTYIHTYTCMQTDRQTERQTDRQTYTHFFFLSLSLPPPPPLCTDWSSITFSFFFPPFRVFIFPTYSIHILTCGVFRSFNFPILRTCTCFLPPTWQTRTPGPSIMVFRCTSPQSHLRSSPEMQRRSMGGMARMCPTGSMWCCVISHAKQLIKA